MTHRAAVLPGMNQPLEVRDDVEIESPHAGEVKVRMGASGVCHSDLSIQNGTLYGGPAPPVFGPRGAGGGEEGGAGVTVVRPGCPTRLPWVPQFGKCHFFRPEQATL